MHALSGIRTHHPSVRASEDSSCLRPRCHCDRRWLFIPSLITKPHFILIHFMQNSQRDILLFIFSGNITDHSKSYESLVPSCYRLLFQHIQTIFSYVTGSTFFHTGDIPMQLQRQFILSEPTCNETEISLQVTKTKVKW
jgi:hypothetical protein